MQKLILVILITLSLHSTVQAKFVIVSDIDDTVKKTRLTNPIAAIVSFVEKKDGPYQHLREIYHELLLAQDDALIIYLSSSYENIYNAQNWLTEYSFPPGLVIQRNLNSPLSGRTFKQNKLQELFDKEILSAQDTFYFFGDGTEKDAEIYQHFITKNNILKAKVYIRDSTMRSRLSFPYLVPYRAPVEFFISEFDLINQLFTLNDYLKLNQSTIQSIYLAHLAHQLVSKDQLDMLEQQFTYHHCRGLDAQQCNKIIRNKISLTLRSYYAQ